MSGSNSRFPQIAVLANGDFVPGVIDAEISQNNFLEANRYRLTFSLEASGYGIWSSNAISLDIRLAFDTNWTSVMFGVVDRVAVDVGSGLVHLDGRDLTSRFLEARTQETFENQTASEIAALLAVRRGLITNITPTTQLNGRDFGGDYSRVTLDQHSGTTTEWDLLVKLADAEAYDVWVSGETLNFLPPSQSLPPVLLTPQDCLSVNMDRTLALCGGLRVSVKSWDCRSQTTTVQTATSGIIDAATRDYVIVRPNLTPTQAVAIARRTLSEMVQNARVVSLEMPGDLTTQPRQTLILTDTNTDFDGSYLITSVERRLSFQHGFTQSLEARTPPWTIS